LGSSRALLRAIARAASGEEGEAHDEHAALRDREVAQLRLRRSGAHRTEVGALQAGAALARDPYCSGTATKRCPFGATPVRRTRPGRSTSPAARDMAARIGGDCQSATSQVGEITHAAPPAVGAIAAVAECGPT
jgi:hypothetical protein